MGEVSSRKLQWSFLQPIVVRDVRRFPIAITLGTYVIIFARRAPHWHPRAGARDSHGLHYDFTPSFSPSALPVGFTGYARRAHDDASHVSTWRRSNQPPPAAVS